jgi:hypothetical protein
MEKKRSIGLIICSIYLILLGVMNLFNINLFTLFLVAGIGLLLLKPFARFLAIILSALAVVLLIASSIFFALEIDPVPFLISPPYVSTEGDSIYIHFLTALRCITYLIIIFFLLRSSTKKQFEE